MKPRTRRKLLFTFIGVCIGAAAALAFVPPLFDLNYLKPIIIQNVANATGMQIKIAGNVRLSLLGRATVSARDVSIAAMSARADSVQFRIPWRSVFNLSGIAKSVIVIDGGYFPIKTLDAPNFTAPIILQNTTVVYNNKKYSDINGTLSRGGFDGAVQTDEHKYIVRAGGGEFNITNANTDLILTGEYAGTANNFGAHGHISFATNDANKWFGFDAPALPGDITFAADFTYHMNDFDFYNISGTFAGGDFSGRVARARGHTTINVIATGITYDFAGALKNTDWLLDTDLDLSLAGRMRNVIPYKIDADFAWNNKTNFNQFMISTISDKKTIAIKSMYAGGDMNVSGTGFITGGFANNIATKIHGQNITANCNYSEYDAQTWDCSPFDYHSENKNMTGVIMSAAGAKIMSFDNAKLSAIGATNPILEMLPNALLSPAGRVYGARVNNGILDALSFDNGIVQIAIEHNDFTIATDVNTWLSAVRPHFNARFLATKLPITISGTYQNGNITNLDITLPNNHLTGKFDGQTFDLNTDALNIDAFISREFLDNFADTQYVSGEPLSLPFALNTNIAIRAKKIILGGETYANFTAALHPGALSASITDDTRGAIIANITREKLQYNLDIRANKFDIKNLLLNDASPINIADSVLSGNAALHTTGITPYDFWHNMAGDIDATFDGGFLVGFDTDNFYAGAKTITKMNGEYAISDALSGGDTHLITAHIVGRYNGGDFTSTRPAQFTARHTNITGTLEINNGMASGDFSVMLRGISPAPMRIALSVNANGSRDFSLSEIMRTFDPDFMREFVKTHDRF